EFDRRIRISEGFSSGTGRLRKNAGSVLREMVPRFESSLVQILIAPSITTQPASKTVLAGQTATFSVTATGTTPLKYQWTKNGANITGATGASYATPSTTLADNASLFAVIVTNSAGSVTSNDATTRL